MLEFCPHCGQVGGLRQQDATLVCSHCGQQAGVMPVPAAPVIIHEADELTRQGAAAICPSCTQLVELRSGMLARHFNPQRKVCPGSSKPAAVADGMTRESVRLVSCRRGEAPRIETWTIAFLDPRDRVRTQIDALRDLLGPQFQLRDYPAPLARPDLAAWTSATACVIGKRHPQAGYQSLSDADIPAVVRDLQQHLPLFLTPMPQAAG